MRVGFTPNDAPDCRAADFVVGGQHRQGRRARRVPPPQRDDRPRAQLPGRTRRCVLGAARLRSHVMPQNGNHRHETDAHLLREFPLADATARVADTGLADRGFAEGAQRSLRQLGREIGTIPQRPWHI